MNGLPRQKVAQEMDCGQCFAYLLEDNDAFLTTEYKVMQSQKENILVNCVKMQFNGKTMLFYMPGNLKPLDSLLPWLSGSDAVLIVENLLESIRKVRDNGFLSCENLDINPARIFVDKSTGRTSLVYLPVAEKIFGDYAAFENAIRSELLEILEKKDGQEVSTLRQRLENGMLSLEEIAASEGGGRDPEPSSNPKCRCALVALNTADRQEIAVTKNPFVIGRHPQMADGAIGFSKAIGRRHCRIDCQDNQYFITDLESKNYTYVNRRRLAPNTPQPLNNGDMVRLADVDFRVEIM